MNIDELIKGPRRPVIIAHRGASFYHHENTMEAFETAVDMRAEMMEFDVRRTKDKVLVIHHDEGIENRFIADLTSTQLGKISESAGFKIPTLVEVLQFCKDRILPDIEIKEPGYEDAVLKTVLEILDPDRFVLSSSHDITILKIKALRPETYTGLILSRRIFPGLIRELLPGARVRITETDIVMVSEQLLGLGFLRFNARLKVPVWVYTVNDRKEMWKYINNERIGAIFTDRPDVGLFLRDLYAVSQKAEEKPEARRQNPE